MEADATCSLCGLPGATLDAGGDVGLCHRPCFVRFDRAAEAFERIQFDIPYQGRRVPPARPRRAHRRVRPVIEVASA